MAGVTLADSFAVAQSAAESRMRDRRQGGISLPTRRRWRRVASSFHTTRVAFGIALDGDSGPAPASSRLLLLSRMGSTCSQRTRRSAMLSARGASSSDVGFIPGCGRIDQLLDASGHVGELVGPQSV